jgi:hypothetical protein
MGTTPWPAKEPGIWRAALHKALCCQASRGASSCYATVLDRQREAMAEFENRVSCFDNMQESWVEAARSSMSR